MKVRNLPLVFMLTSCMWMQLNATEVLPLFDGFVGNLTAVDRQPVRWVPGDGGATDSIGSNDGNMILSNTGGVAGAYIEEASPSNPDSTQIADVSARTQLRFVQEGVGTSFAALGARGDAGELYWAGVEVRDNVFLAGTVDASRGLRTVISEPLGDFDALAEDVILQLETIGTSISFGAYEVGNSSPIAAGSFSDVVLTDGGLGMFINGASGATREVAFRWFEASATNVLSGDYDADGDYSCDDINALTAEIAAGTNTAFYDVDGDGLVTQADLVAWRAEAGAAELPSGNPYLEGDANLDGVVDVADFNLWNANKFTANASWCDGDFNADGNIDVGDFNLWNANKFTSADAATVPEPSGLVMALSLLALGLAIRSTGFSRKHPSATN